MLKQRKRKLFFRKLKRRIFYAIVIVLAFLTFLMLEHKMNAEYEAGRCAGYGYESDCQTPLK